MARAKDETTLEIGGREVMITHPTKPDEDFFFQKRAPATGTWTIPMSFGSTSIRCRASNGRRSGKSPTSSTR